MQTRSDKRFIEAANKLRAEREALRLKAIKTGKAITAKTNLQIVKIVRTNLKKGYDDNLDTLEDCLELLKNERALLEQIKVAKNLKTK